MKQRIIVLRTIKYGEADLIVHGLDPQGARMNFIARGALKSKKRFGGGLLEPTHYLAVTYAESHRRGDEEPLHTLQEASLLKSFPGLRSDYDRLEMALGLLQLVSRIGQHGVDDSSALFDLLGNALSAAETSARLDLLRLQFEVKILSQQGVMPPGEIWQEFLRRPLRDHETLPISSELRARFQREADQALRGYLDGISPSFSSNSIEI